MGGISTRLTGGLERLRTGRGMAFRMARGSLWLGAGSGAENVARIVRNMILARLLTPGAFGAMAIVLAVNGAFEALTEVGIREAVIQNPRGARRTYLNGAWWLAAVRGLLLYAVAWLAAPWAAGFYDKPGLTPLMRVAFLGIIFNGLVSARAYVALKRLRYRPWVVIQQGGSLLGIATAVILGVLTGSIWALAIGFAVEAAGRCLLSYIVCPWRPGLQVDRESLRSLLRFAGGMAGVPLLTLLYAKSDVFVLGKMVSDEALGLYVLAASLAFIPDTLCAMAVSPVLLPALSKMQYDPERLKHNLLRIEGVLALVFVPPLLLMAALGPWLLRFVYGEPYGAAAGVFAVLCAGVGVRVLGWAPVTTFFAIGRPELGRRTSAVRLIVLAATIVPLVHWRGPLGAALALFISGLAWAGFSVWLLRRIFTGEWKSAASGEDEQNRLRIRLRETSTKKKTPYRACLLGASLDGGNLGVSALAVATIGLIRQARPEARIQMFYGERRGGLRCVETAAGTVNARVLNYRLSPRARAGEHLALLTLAALAWRAVPPLRGWLLRRNPRLRALAAADFTGTLHGGDSFSDIYGLRRFLIGILPDAIVVLLRKRLVFLPQTYGPFNSAAARVAARWVMRRADRLYARDRQSVELVRAMLGAAAPQAEFCPDVAFSLPALECPDAAVEPPLPEESAEPLVGLNVSGLLAMGGYTRANMFGLACDYNALMNELIDALAGGAGARVLIVPHVIDDSGENDAVAGARLWRAAAERHPGRVHLVSGAYGACGIKRIIGCCDLFIGSRMHACIAALSQGVPAIGIAYSAKFAGVFGSGGAGALALDARNMGKQAIVARCLEALAERESIGRNLQARAEENREHLGRCFRRELENQNGKNAECEMRNAEWRMERVASSE